MFKETFHPKAYLSGIRNVRLGLMARTRILDVLEKLSAEAKTIAQKTKMRYGVVMHHLKLLEAEGIVERKSSKPYVWMLTGVGQERLVNSF